jgi:tetratricopeptide (TPR) repeat protein
LTRPEKFYLACSTIWVLRSIELCRITKRDYDGQVIRLNPQSAEAYYKRGFVYQKMGQRERAIDDFDKAIHIDPQFVRAYSNRAFAYLNNNQYDLAIADCTKAINLDPNDAVARLNRGVAYRLQDNKAEAKADFEKVIKTSLTTIG